MFKLIFSLLLAIAPVYSAHAGWQPSGTITFIVPFGTGGNSDIISRAIADRLSQELGQKVTIENRAGAGGAIATRDIAKAVPNGLTIGLSTVSTFGSNHVFFDSPLYHPVNDFEHIITIAATPKVVIIRPDSGVSSIKQLIHQSRLHPTKFYYGAAGLTVDHLYGELFKIESGARIQLVPYKSGAPAMLDFLGGHVQIVFDNLPLVINHVKEGRARLLAVSWPTRLSDFPEVPTWAELGYSGLSASTWYGVVAPKNTPAAVITRLNQAINQVLKDPEVIQRLTNAGAVAVGGRASQHRQLVTETYDRLMKIGAESGVQKQLR